MIVLLLTAMIALVVTARRKSPIWDSHCRTDLRVWGMRTGIFITVCSSDRFLLERLVREETVLYKLHIKTTGYVIKN
jgi:hypothetical protein